MNNLKIKNIRLKSILNLYILIKIGANFKMNFFMYK